MKHVIFLYLMVFITGIQVYAQRNFAEEADRKFAFNQYYDALLLYKKAYTKVTGNKIERARILYQIGLCYIYIGDYKNAEASLKRVVAANYPDPQVYLHYANVLKINEKYEEALMNYQEYKKRVPDDPRGDIGIESCQLAVKWRDEPGRYEIENIKKINSRANDFAPVFADKKYRSLVFSTARDEVQGKGYDAWTGQPFTDLFYVEIDRKGNWGTPVPLDETGAVNTPHNEGAATFNSKFNTMYFTRCVYEKKKKSGCQIYVATKKGKDWGEVEMLQIAADTFTVGHPALTDDELTLYFASNIPGGYGGRDIWMIQRPKKNRPWGNPVNLGSVINTPGDELFPTLKDDNTLYFSSNYHPGLGGLDIFVTYKDENGNWSKPENMKPPINSSADDCCMAFNLDQKQLRDAGAKEMGFFSSNRKAGGRGGYDIWSFKLPPILFTLSGVVYCDSTKAPLAKAIVVCKGSDGNVYVDTTDAKGFYKFDNTQILENTFYELEVSKTDYFNERGRETTVGLTKSTDLVRNFYLVPIPKKPIVLPEIRYDLAKWDLKPEFHDSLEGLIRILQENPNIVIELQSHTDIRPIPMTNDTLSQRRAQSVVDYLIQRGIDPERLVAKGYGDRVPRTLEKDITITYNNKTFTFPKGVTLTKEYIESLPTRDHQEAAHQLNRRTTFQIIRTDYVPKQTQNVEVKRVQIQIVTEEDMEQEKNE